MQPPADGLASRLFLGPALRTQPDRRLVTLVREGYETAFEEIVRRYGRPLARYAASIVGGRSEDVTQDAFSKALMALRRNGDEIDLRPWLFRIVRNTALNDLRDNPPSPEVLAEAVAGGRDPVEELERREELADLMKRLRALPEPQRAAIVMRELEGLGHEEIAAALGLSGGAARQTIYRARRALRDGAGMLIPLPLLQALLAGSGSGAAEAAAGAAGIGSAAGAGVALKATAATVLVAGAVGAGVALKDNQRNDAKQTPVQVLQRHSEDTASLPAAVAPQASRGNEPGDDRGGGGPEQGDDHGHGGNETADNRSGSGHENRGPSSGHGGGSGDGGSGSDRGGRSGSGDGGPEPNSGSGGHGSEHGGGVGSSSGGGGPGPSDDPGAGDPLPSEEPPVDDGSGSSGSGSGSGSGDESGSGESHSGKPG